MLDALPAALRSRRRVSSWSTLSIGAAIYPEHGRTRTRCSGADAALYLAKGAGKGRWRSTPRPCIRPRRCGGGSRANSVTPCERGEFRLAYQPRYALDNRRLIAVEALLRWQHPEFGNLPTNQFIAVAEASGLIREIGHWVLDAACDQGRRWRDAGHPIRVAVNLSAVEFRHPNLPAQIRGTLDRAGLDPAMLELEITESAYMERDGDSPHSGVEEVRRLGVRLAIDDFGTGWSSLAYLKWLPFDVLKVDRVVRAQPRRGSARRGDHRHDRHAGAPAGQDRRRRGGGERPAAAGPAAAGLPGGARVPAGSSGAAGGHSGAAAA